MADPDDPPGDVEATAVTDTAAFSAALEAACPDRQPTAVEKLGRGNRKLTRLVRFEHGDPVVVQLAATGDGAVAETSDQAGLRAEALVLRALRERTDVPVPAVLADGTVRGTDYLVTERVGGEDLHERFAGLDGDVQRRLARTFGRHLAAVHDAFSFAGYGPLDATGDGLTPRADQWGTWFCAYGQAAVGRLPPAFDDLQGELGELLAGPLPEPDPPATLFPWDFRPGNALYRDGAVTAVLDWEQPLSAAPALPVAKAEYLVVDWYVDDPEPLRAAFREGYGSVRPVPEVRPVHRAVAVAASAVDTAGAVTRPSYPERDREGSVAFHRRALQRVLDGAGE
jgi:aminoglycoside phosphotransferase (APT) family kinase protein